MPETYAVLAERLKVEFKTGVRFGLKTGSGYCRLKVDVRVIEEQVLDRFG